MKIILVALIVLFTTASFAEKLDCKKKSLRPECKAKELLEKKAKFDENNKTLSSFWNNIRKK